MSGAPMVGAGAGFAVDGQVRVKADAARGTVFYGSHHAGLDFGNEIVDIEAALYARNQRQGIRVRLGILQVIKRSTVGDGADEGGVFERREGDSIAEAGHHADA